MNNFAVDCADILVRARCTLACLATVLNVE